MGWHSEYDTYNPFPAQLLAAIQAGGSSASYYTQLTQIANLYSQCPTFTLEGVPSATLAAYNSCIQNGQQICTIQAIEISRAFGASETQAEYNTCVQTNTVSCGATPTAGSIQGYFDYANFIAAYPSVSTLLPSGSQVPSLYQRLINTFAPLYTEQTYSVGLSQAMQMDITAQATGMASQLATQASFSVLQGIYTQLQEVNQNLENIDQQLVQVNSQLATMESTLKAIQQNTAASSSAGDASGGGGGFGDVLSGISDVLDIAEFFL